MKISLDWLGDFVDLSGIDPDTIADRLTLATAEVDGVETLQRSLAGAVIGEVVSCAPLGATTDGGQTLHAATVDCGKAGRFETVCGAPNVRVGLKSAFAPAGATLADGEPIRAGKLAGHPSEGILCSARELGMSHWHEIVLECPPSTANGTPLGDLLPPGDTLIEVDNKSLTHRPDLWSHCGFARELAALFHRELRPLELIELSRFDHLPEYPVAIDDLDGCPFYSCIEFRAPGAVPSPLRMQARLHALGQRSHNLLVDLTNYVLLEVGQPTHAFDADRLKAIRVAAMGKDGPFYTLDEQQRAMRADDLMIWNERQPVALAGIMGGRGSQVEPSTTRVLLESANFKGSRVRRTSVRLGLRTESSQRFEKSLPPITVQWATARILHLMEQAGVAVDATSRFSFQGDVQDRFRRVELPAGYVAAKGGLEISPGKVTSILSSLGFRATYLDDGRLNVDVPPFRSQRDISIPADIIEEVLRIYGYDNIEPALPSALLSPVSVNKPLRAEHRARRLLTGGHRFIEVQTYAWLDDPWLAAIGWEPDPTLALRNPSVEHKRRLRTTLLPNLLALVPANRVHRDDFRLFEIGRVFQPRGEDGCLETTSLAGVSYTAEGRGSLEDHFRDVKSALEDLARALGCGGFGFAEPASTNDVPWQTEGNWVAVQLDRAPVGTAGVLGGAMRDKVAEGGQVVWFELAMDRLEGTLYPVVRHLPTPVYPGSWQDFSLVWDLEQGFLSLKQQLDSFSHPVVRKRSFLFTYQGKGLPPGKGSYTFRYWLGCDDRTISSEDIDGFRADFMTFLDAAGIPLR